MTEWESEALPVLRAIHRVAKTKTPDWCDSRPRRPARLAP
jgi:hypothetical protein